MAIMNPLQMLKARQNGRTVTDFAAEIGCSQSYLSLVLLGKSKPGPMILKYLGLESYRRTHYRSLRVDAQP
jgi:transcriptional regulator with XRE-family HTH domain